MAATRAIFLCAILLALATSANAQVEPTPIPEGPVTPPQPGTIEEDNPPLVVPTPATTASPPTVASSTPTQPPTTAPVVVIEMPISEMLPDNTLLEEPGAMEMVEELREEVVAQGTCNANVCFALDGSRRLSTDEFRAVQDFVTLVSAIVGVDSRAAFAAVQYGRRNRPISSLTNDVDAFLVAVDNTVSLRSSRSRLVAGLRFCVRQLRPRREDANKIVILGDGRSRGAGNPVSLARRSRRPRGNAEICAVGVGFTNTRRLLRITGSANRVLAIDGYFELLDIIDQLVAEICDFDT